MFLGCSPKQCKKDDPKVVERILQDFIKALSDREFEKLESISTTDLVIYEDGSIWNNDSLVQAFSGVAEISFQLMNFDTKVDCNSARTKYINIGKFELPDKTVKVKFLESASFIKEKGLWKIEFIHSTPMK
ncbi:hypothetical protein BTO04_03565 [Polaribacter sp. SA4-10]|uniref:nuclear transport factor 2 family protein n=1 Tax=Polaribacter sp. SA4-10 TaxID=754397 RepID=UPI000B3D2964|nr:nuclear transport factor 2 family protein [Polaribacter sp. SA4-10]ARV05831.1 hypothetical protein BTO04_03565 [Polaribacter sp. SA4-10]